MTTVITLGRKNCPHCTISTQVVCLTYLDDADPARYQWYCKNILCTGPHAEWFRSKLSSFARDEDHISYYLDRNEWIKKAEEYLKRHPDSHYVAVVN